MAIQKLITAQVVTKKLKAKYKKALKKLTTSTRNNTDGDEEWKCISPFGAVVVRISEDTAEKRVEVEGTYQGIEYVLKKLKLADLPRFIQSVHITADSLDDVSGSCSIC